MPRRANLRYRTKRRNKVCLRQMVSLSEKYRICCAERELLCLLLDCQDMFGPWQLLATCISTTVHRTRSLDWMLGLKDMVHPSRGSLYHLEPQFGSNPQRRNSSRTNLCRQAYSVFSWDTVSHRAEVGMANIWSKR